MLKAIKRRVAREQRAHECRERLGRILRVGTFSENCNKCGVIFLYLPQALLQGGQREVHFFRVLYRLERLLFERFRASIPKERLTVSAVQQRRRVASAAPILDSGRHFPVAGERALRLMTRSARQRAVAREAL